MAVKGTKGKKTQRNTGGGPRKWLGLLVVILLLVAIFAGLEALKSSRGQAPVPSATPESSAPSRQSAMSSAAVKAPTHRTLTTHISPTPSHRLPVTVAAGEGGRVAIIIDDMGTYLHEAQSLMAIGVPLTFAVIPGLPKTAEVAAAARKQGYQVMIHLPMEPEGYPQRRLEHNGLLLAHSSDEIRQRVDAYLQALPQAQGANNHMGSRFTANPEKMRVVLEKLREHNLFFVDSVTSPHSVAYREARALGLQTAARQVFIDNEQDVGKIRRQLLQLAAVARKRGAAIGICHPHPATIKALQLVLPELAKSGITFVSAGDLVS